MRVIGLGGRLSQQEEIMARRRVPEFISGMTKGQEVLLALWEVVVDLGGSQEDILRLRQDKDLSRKVGKLLVGLAEVEMLHPEHIVDFGLNPDIRLRALEHIDNQAFLGRVARTNEYKRVRDTARARITDPRELYETIVNGQDALQEEAHVNDVKRLDFGHHLVHIAHKHQCSEVQLAAVDRLHELGQAKFLADVVIAEGIDVGKLNGHMLDSAQAQVKDPYQIERILVHCENTTRILKAADALMHHPTVLIGALIDLELPVETITSLDWFYDKLVESLQLAEADTEDNLSIIASEAKSTQIARRALRMLKEKKVASGETVYLPSEEELVAWRTEQTQAD